MSVDPQPVPFLDLGTLHRERRTELDAAMGAVVESGQFVSGPFVDQFEREFAEYCEVAQCVGVANGTDALELILVGLGIGPGDEVIVPANTFVATVEAVVTCGATPRFVDVSPTTLLMDLEDVSSAISPATAAVIAVHLYGQMADVSGLAALADRHGLALIEDAAQAHGARFDGRRAGSAGRAAAFSFYPGKNLGAFGDGGAVVTDDEALARTIRCLANHGRDEDDRFRHPLSGRNSRLDGLQAAVLSVKLRYLDADNAGRVAAMAWYRDLLPSHIPPVATAPKAAPVHHLAIVRTLERPGVTRVLDEHRIGWGLHYPVPCHVQPAFSTFADRPLPVAERAADEILSLPMSPRITPDQIARVCDVLAARVPAVI